jgi:hypothetical protein
MVKIEDQEPIDKQPTEVMPAVKPPTVNSLIVEQVKDIAELVVFLARIVTIRNLVIMVLVVTLLNVALSIYMLTAISILFGRAIP